MADLDSLVKDLEKARSEADSENSRAKKALAALQKEIKEGKSTGDIVKDYSILFLGANLAYETKLRELYNEVKAHRNQLVLVEVNYTEINDLGIPHGCFGGGSISEGRALLNLGVLREECIGFNFAPKELMDLNSRINLVTMPKIILDLHSISRNSLRLEQEPEVQYNGDEAWKLKIPEALYFEYGMKLGVLTEKYLSGLGCRRKFNRFGDHSGFGHKVFPEITNFEVYIGNEAVDKYFKTNDMKPAIYQDPLFLPPKFYTYKNFRNMLLSPNAINDYIQEKSNVLKERNREKIERTIEELYNPFITKIEAPYVKDTLAEALKFELHLDPRMVQIKDHQGIYVNVGELVRGLCKKYKVKLPK